MKLFRRDDFISDAYETTMDHSITQHAQVRLEDGELDDYLKVQG